MNPRLAANALGLLVSLCLLLASVGAHAAELRVYIDSDNNFATGCTVPFPGGSFVGAEEVLITNVDTSTSPPTVGAVVQQTCVAPPAVLSAPAPVAAGGWSVGVGVGVGGFDVIETYFPALAPVGTYRFGFLYIDPVTGADSLVTVTGTPAGGPIIFAFGALVPIPTLTDAGIFLLAFLLWIAAARALRRHKAPTALVSALFVVAMAGATIAAVTLDGQIADWTGVPQLAGDPVGDSPGGSDMVAAFAKFEPSERRVYLRVDVKTASPPTATGDAYSTGAGVPLAIAAPGVLANDAPGIPAATITSFGGGDAGGTVATNAAGATVMFGAGGSLSVDVNGGVAFTPAAGFAGPFAFSYRATNAHGSSDGLVTINVTLPPAITSANATTFLAGTANTFTATATGFPAPALALGSCAPALPAGVGFVDNGNGTGTLSGNPPPGSAGAYGCTLTAASTSGSATQGFTLTVNEGPVAANDAYSIAHDTTLTVPAATGLLSNDAGVPAPTVTNATGGGPGCAPPCTFATANGTATVAVDGSFSYTPAALFAGTDGFSYTATNAGGSSGATVTLSVTNAPPVVDLNGPATGIDFGPAAFTEGGGPVAIVEATQLTVSDADSANLGSATIVIANLLDGAAESLAVTCPDAAPGCSGAILLADVTYTAATGTLAIVRSAPIAAYQALLRTLAYDNASPAPTTTNRDITVAVNDAIGDNTPLAHATVALSAVNGAPSVTAPATAVTPVNTAFNFGATVSVADPDSASSPVQVTLTATNGTATMSGTAGLSVTGNGGASVVSTGPVAAQNTALAGLVFTPAAAFSGAASLRIDVDDQGNTGSGGALTATHTVNITVDTPPSVTGTTPANGATSVGLNATITVNFSEPVTVTGTAFKLECPMGSARAFSVAPASPAASFVLTPAAPLPEGVPCTVTVVAAQVTDSAGQHPAADYATAFTVDTLPTVTSTVPANAAPAAAPSTMVTVNFSEPVNASAASFTLECPAGSAKAFTLSASPSATFVLTPTAPLPTGTTCAATVVAANVIDVDASQPMAANFAFGFTTATAPAITSAALANFSVGVAGTFTVTATGNPTPSITRTGTLPSGLGFLDNGDGTATISGTPAAGTDATSPYAQVLTATNLGGSATQNFTLNVCPVIAATPAAIAQPTRTGAYSFNLGASGGTGPYTFAVTGGSLPAALAMSAAGAISGTVTGAGAYAFTVTVTDTATGCTGATAYSGTVNEPPVATADSFQAVGNTLLEVAATGVAGTPKILVTASNVLSNDNAGGDGPAALTVTAGTYASTNGGTVTMAANGEFTYLPPAGFTGADTFDYAVSDGVGTATGTVTVTLIQKVWHVKNDGAAGDGRSSSPFNTMAAAIAASGVGDTIYVFRGDGTVSGQNTGAILKAGQRLVGEGVDLDIVATVNGVVNPVLRAAGSRPLLGNAAGVGVTLDLGNTLRGIDIGNATGGAALYGANVGLLSVGNVSISTAGAGVDITGVGTPPVIVVLDSVSSAGGAKNVNLVGLGGTVDLGGGVLSGSSSHAFDVSGGTAIVTYSGSVSNSSTGARVVSVASKTGGSVSLSGPVTSSGTNPAGVVLTSNPGATISFSGGLSLGTGTNAAFTATGGGTVNATQNNTTIVNTAATTTGTAVNLSGVGGSVTFRSVTANGATTGISLANTTGSFTVTGNSSGNCGGVVVNNTTLPTAPDLADCTGGTITNAATGIRLDGASNVSLTRMRITGTSAHNFGIYGTSVTNFTLARSVVDGSIGATTGGQDAAIAFGRSNPGGINGLLGTNQITDSTIAGAIEHNMEFYNQSGTLALTVARTVVKNNSAGGGSDGILMEMQGTADATVLVDNSYFADNKSQAIQVAANDSSVVDFTVRNSKWTRTFQGNEGIVLSNGANGRLTANVAGNIATEFGGVSIFVGQTPGNATASSLLQATIQNNTVTAPTTATNHAIMALLTSTAGQSADARLLVQGNTVTQNSTSGVARGILVDTPDNGTDPQFDATVNNNSVSILDAVNGVAGLVVQARKLSVGCMAIQGNNVTVATGGVNAIRARQADTATANLSGAGVNAAAVLAANNAPSTTEVLGTVGLTGAACLLPANPQLP